MAELTPMLASPSDNTDTAFRRLMSSGGWTADVKLDGIRAWAFWAGGTVELFNRRRVPITHRFPEVVDELTAALQGIDSCVIDGEIVHHSGSFEAVATRDKQTNRAIIERMSDTNPCILVGFDVPSAGGTYLDRRLELDRIRRLSEQRQVPLQTTTWSNSDEFFARTRQLGLEGVIAKRNTSTYQYSRRSPDWIKWKNVVRVSCVAIGYEPGNGARKHFGAMHLALFDDDGRTVTVGRVGTGFNARQILELKDMLDRGEEFVVEIECLNQTSGGQLRFPSFKGVRTDVLATDCTIHQLDQLTKC